MSGLLCACGCGNATIPNRGRARRYIHGHNRRTRDIPEGTPSEKARRMVLDLIVAANNLATGHMTLDERDAAAAHVLGYIGRLEWDVAEANTEAANLLDDRNTLMEEARAR